MDLTLSPKRIEEKYKPSKLMICALLIGSGSVGLPNKINQF